MDQRVEARRWSVLRVSKLISSKRHFSALLIGEMSSFQTCWRISGAHESHNFSRLAARLGTRLAQIESQSRRIAQKAARDGQLDLVAWQHLLRQLN